MIKPSLWICFSCLSCSLLCLLTNYIEPQAARAADTWVLNQKCFNRGQLKSEIGQHEIRITLNSGAQIFAAAPDWKVYVYSRKTRSYCAWSCDKYRQFGLMALPPDHLTVFRQEAKINRSRTKTGPIGSQPATCFVIHFPEPIPYRMDVLTMSQSASRKIISAIAQELWLADNIIMDPHAALILSTTCYTGEAYDRAILRQTDKFDDGSVNIKIDTLSISREKNDIKFDPSILKFKQVFSVAEIATAGNTTDLKEVIDGFGFAR